MFDTQLKIDQFISGEFRCVAFLMSLWFGSELRATLKLREPISYLVIMNISFVSSSIVDDKVG